MLGDSQIIENSLELCDNASGATMLTPEVNADKINYFINDPSISDWVRGDLKGVLDAKVLVENKDNYFFCDEHGGCGFIKLRPSVYELHSFVRPEGRGSWVKYHAKMVFDWIFKNTDATAIVTLCPKNNRMAIGAARYCGFKKYDTLEKSWIYKGEIFDMDAYVLHKECK